MTVALSSNQKLFAAALSQGSGLNPATVESWMTAEEPPGASTGYQGTQDWLNVGITDSGPKGATNDVWSDPTKAGAFTAQWLKGQAADPGFGTASPGIQSIAKTAGQTPAQQLAAIANSGWASSGYGGVNNLLSILKNVTGSNITLPAATTEPTAPTPVASQTVKPAANVSAPQTSNIFSVLENLEKARDAITGQATNTDPVQSGWNSLSKLITAGPTQQQASAQASANETQVVGKAIQDGANAPAGAQKVLNMAMRAIGGPYSMAHHATAFTESAAQIKQQGTDCSGFVSWLMGPDGLGIWKNALTTPDIPNAPGLQAGKGNSITLYNSPSAGAFGHVFIEINGKYFQSAGGGLGISSITASTARSMIQSGDNGVPYSPLHPKGY